MSERKMLRCHHCDIELPDNYNYCPYCSKILLVNKSGHSTKFTKSVFLVQDELQETRLNMVIFFILALIILVCGVVLGWFFKINILIWACIALSVGLFLLGVYYIEKINGLKRQLYQHIEMSRDNKQK